jgi:hypothetical protein
MASPCPSLNATSNGFRFLLAWSARLRRITWGRLQHAFSNHRESLVELFAVRPSHILFIHRTIATANARGELGGPAPGSHGPLYIVCTVA